MVINKWNSQWEIKYINHCRGILKSYSIPQGQPLAKTNQKVPKDSPMISKHSRENYLQLQKWKKKLH